MAELLKKWTSCGESTINKLVPDTKLKGPLNQTECKHV